MANLVYADPFDYWIGGGSVHSEGLWTQAVGGAGAYGTSFGRFGGHGVRLSASVDRIRKALDESEIYMGFGVTGGTVTDSGTGRVLAEVSGDGGTTHLWIVAMATGAIQVRVGSNLLSAPVVDFANNALQFGGVNQHFQAWVVIHDSTGRVQIVINDDQANPVVDFTGNTRSTGLGASQVTSLAAGQQIGVSAPAIDVQDYWLATGGYLGDQRVVSRFVTGNGSHVEWTPNTGTAAECVDDTFPDGDTTYIETSTVGDRASFEHDDADAETTDVTAVMLASRIVKTDAGAATYEHGIRQGTTDAYSGIDHDFPGTYAYVTTPFDTDPTDSNPWTVAKLDSLQSIGRRSS